MELKPSSFYKKAIHYLWLHGWKYHAMERTHRKYVATISGKDRINVVFMALDLALWRYQHLYEMMAADKRFKATIVLSPCVLREHQEKDLDRLRQFFNERGIRYIDFKPGEKPIDIRGELNPDIIFYTQPYEYLLSPEHDCRYFYDKLLCYIPYAFWTATGKKSYNLHFHNMAWRLYYSTDMHLKDAQDIATNKGRNVRVVGYSNADDYLFTQHKDVWNKMADGRKRKRIIWAPHYSIWHTSTFPPRSNFLWMAELMVTIAREYSDQIQIAFKPHPALLTQLYGHKDWGREQTDAYYNLWRTMENTQEETGSFIDLFMTSDAMIHDSASFTVEYHYSQKPVMFVTKDAAPIIKGQSDFGKKAFAMQYFGATEQDIRRFIDDVVLGENDPMLPLRQQFYDNYLLPPNGKSVAQNVLDDIVESLGLKDEK